MKIKTTNKYIKAMYRNVFSCGYCDLQEITRGIDEPIYYNCGVYGWNYDGYVDYRTDTAITTGYRNMTGARIPSEILKKYTEKAKKIREKYSFSEWDKEKKALEKNYRKFIDELVNA